MRNILNFDEYVIALNEHTSTIRTGDFFKDIEEMGWHVETNGKNIKNVAANGKNIQGEIKILKTITTKEGKSQTLFVTAHIHHNERTIDPSTIKHFIEQLVKEYTLTGDDTYIKMIPYQKWEAPPIDLDKIDNPTNFIDYDKRKEDEMKMDAEERMRQQDEDDTNNNKVRFHNAELIPLKSLARYGSVDDNCGVQLMKSKVCRKQRYNTCKNTINRKHIIPHWFEEYYVDHTNAALPIGVGLVKYIYHEKLSKKDREKYKGKTYIVYPLYADGTIETSEKKLIIESKILHLNNNINE